MIESCKLVIKGLQESTVNALKIIYQNIQGIRAPDHAARAHLQGLVGYYNGNDFDPPEGFRNADMARTSLGYIIGSLIKNEDYTLKDKRLKDAALALCNDDRKAAYDDLIKCCVAQAIEPDKTKIPPKGAGRSRGGEKSAKKPAE